MDTFKFVVELEVNVDAFEEVDAIEMIRDSFGLGEDCGVEIVSLKIFTPKAVK